jgi:hypothetical protein
MVEEVKAMEGDRVTGFLLSSLPLAAGPGSVEPSKWKGFPKGKRK